MSGENTTHFVGERDQEIAWTMFRVQEQRCALEDAAHLRQSSSPPRSSITHADGIRFSSPSSHISFSALRSLRGRPLEAVWIMKRRRALEESLRRFMMPRIWPEVGRASIVEDRHREKSTNPVTKDLSLIYEIGKSWSSVCFAASPRA